jgi:hypothetical protein
LQANNAEAVKISWLPVASLSIYILAFSVGFGPIPWVMMSELFAPEIKTLASSISGWFISYQFKNGSLSSIFDTQCSIVKQD